MSNVSCVLRKPQPAPRSLSPIALPHERLHMVSTLAKRQITWPMWVTVTTLSIMSLVIPVVVNAQMAMTSYAMYTQRLGLSQLQDCQADLVMRAREAQSPQKSIQRAWGLGLIPAGSSGYINLTEHSVTPGRAVR